MRLLLVILLATTFRSGDLGVATARGQYSVSFSSAVVTAEVAPPAGPPRFRRSNRNALGCGSPGVITDAGDGAISGFCSLEVESPTNCGAILYIGVPTPTLTSFSTTSVTPANAVGSEPSILYTDSATTFNGSRTPGAADNTIYQFPLPDPGAFWVSGAGTVNFVPPPADWVRGWPVAALGPPVAADDGDFYWLSFPFICAAPFGAWSITAPVLTF